ncbi:hypothetical protein KR074_000924 [Drosophila pseudoananassae]|nr:hypothetical protein KR074_000924 [Drosophila pseudoananassae]
MNDIQRILPYLICAPVALLFMFLYCYYFYLNFRECRRTRGSEVTSTDSEVRV